MPNYPGRKKGTRRIVVWNKGKPHERIVAGTKADGAKAEAKLRLELEATDHRSRVVPTFAKLCSEKYIPFAEGHLAKTTWRARKNILVSLTRFFGKKRITDITTGDCDAYRDFRREESELGLGPASMNTELRTLKYVLVWAQNRGYAVRLPKIDYEKETDGRVRLWTPEQVEHLLEVARVHDPRLVPVIVFLVNTGCRKGEAIAAEWSWMDFVAGMVRIPATEFWSPKSGRAREVPMADAVRAALSGPRRSDRWVFPNRDLGRFEFFPDHRFKLLQTKAGLTGGPHTLRHTYASAFLQQVPDLFLLSEILGHSHERITQLYAHLLPGHLQRARNAVNLAPPTMVATVAAGAGTAKSSA
jgi:integrase